MSTKLIRAKHQDGFTTSAHDSEFPLGMFQEIYRAGYTSLEHFSVDLLDYKGDLLEMNWDWKTQRVEVSLGDLVEHGFTFPTPPCSHYFDHDGVCMYCQHEDPSRAYKHDMTHAEAIARVMKEREQD